jgi:hypothetical protein
LTRYREDVDVSDTQLIAEELDDLDHGIDRLAYLFPEVGEKVPLAKTHGRFRRVAPYGCVFDEQRYFLLSTLTIPVNGFLDPWVITLWAEVERREFGLYVEFSDFDSDGDDQISLPGVLANDLSPFTDANRAGVILLVDAEGAPEMRFANGSNLSLARAQRDGIDAEKLEDAADLMRRSDLAAH